LSVFAVTCFTVNRATGRNLRRLFRPFSQTRQTKSECSGIRRLQLLNEQLKTTKYAARYIPHSTTLFLPLIQTIGCVTVTCCYHLPTFCLRLLSATKIIVGDLSVKHAERARARRMGVADLYNTCSDWSPVKECRPLSARNVADVFMVSATFVGNCEQSVICADLGTSVRVYCTALEYYCILMLPTFLSCAIFQF